MPVEKKSITKPLQVFQLIYLSSATQEMSDNELRKILSGSQSRNASQGISGLLLHSEGNIIQIMEGPEDAVKQLFLKIKEDRRHTNVTVVTRRYVAKRDFPHHSMGFKRVKTQITEKALPGFTDIIENKRIPEETLASLSKQVSVFLKSYAKVTRIDH